MRNKGKNRSTASIHILYVHVDFHLHSMMRVKCSVVCKFSYLKDRKRICLYRPNISTKGFQIPLIKVLWSIHVPSIYNKVRNNFYINETFICLLSTTCVNENIKIKREKIMSTLRVYSRKLPPTWVFNGVGFKYINLFDEKNDGSSFSQLL